MKKIYICLILVLLMSSNLVFSQWQLLRAPGKNCRIDDVEVKSDTILIRISNNIYKSTNFGNTWIQLNSKSDKYFSLNVLNDYNSLKIHKGNIFVMNLIGLNKIDKGIFKTSDDGNNWNNTAKGLPLNSTYTFYSTSDALYVLSNSNLWKYNTSKELWEIPYDTLGLKLFSKSTVFVDNEIIYFGRTFSKEPLPNESCKYPNIYKIDTKSNQLYEYIDTTSGICRYSILSLLKRNGYLYAGTTGGLFISTNNGVVWTKSGTKLIYRDSIYSNTYHYYKLSEKNNYLYALVTEYSSDSYIINQNQF